MTIGTETLYYRGDDVDLEATLYLDDAVGGGLAGVLLFPEALGPGPNVYDRARRLAEAGYAALVCDLHGGVVHSFTNSGAGAMGMPDFARYDAAADRASWNAMMALFADTIG
ncbi:MAG TPA: hypothetical protein VIG90_12380 [Pedomonas sp.]|uniref:hypothetical protein n=1 Tax=Pedomonas sp. TaxID=2976421 RepID=UPI002F3E911F